MRSSEGKRFVYEKPQLIEVICQLRFPAILSIDAKDPADFQETVRENFPRYVCQNEKVQAPGDQVRTVRNHTFISEDNSCKLSLTKNFIALSSVRYEGWEAFAGILDEPLGQFISLYRPAFFERVGLRYVNGVSRELLGLEDRRWNDLFQPQYLGVLDDDNMPEQDVTRCAIDVELRLGQREGVLTGAKIHAGPGTVKRNVRAADGSVKTLQERNARFIFDQDLFAAGKVALPEVMQTLEELHEHADRFFSEAITDVLHDAMEAVEL